MTLRGGVEGPLSLGRVTVRERLLQAATSALFFDHTFYHKKYFS